MKYAITPKGIGKPPGARCIRDETPLAPGETFTVLAFEPGQVLAEDGLSLRAKTEAELALEAAAAAAAVTERDGQVALAADGRADAIFTALATATPAQIATFVTNRFPGFTAPQQAVMKVLLQVAALVLRRAG